ncbi:MAG: cyclic nucleotide-binding domain-containing protein [Elusimicrobia bacterium]|nr:cyclic nucleotide-binding domain-containing protein [Elusimicrobiota bacterium]
MVNFSPSGLLAAHPAFSSLPAALLDEVGSRLKEESFPPGSAVIREGERGDRLFLITAGQAEVRIETASGPTAVARLAAGALFGELALLSPDKKRTATVVALCDLSAATLDAAAFQAILAKHPEAERHFVQAAEQLLLTDFLKLASPFGALKTERLRLLARRIHRLSLKRGGEVVREGENGRSCFLVRTGQVEVSRQEQGLKKVVAILGPGSLFGESALLTESPRNASVKALEAAELLEIRREDFLELIQEDQTLNRQIFELLGLRDAPRRVPGIQEHAMTTEEGVSITILSDPARGTYFRLTPHGRLIWDNLDGRKNLQDLALLYFETFRLFAPQAIAETVSGLVAAGFAESRTSRATWLFLPSWGQRAVGFLRFCLEWRVMLRNTDGLSARLYRAVSPLFTRSGQIALAAVSLAGLGFFLRDVRAAPRLGASALSPGVLIAGVACFVVSGLLHEAGHALATKSFGRKILGVGIGWNWITPILFVDTSDMWLAPRGQRMAVHWAGPYVHLILGGMAALLAHASQNPAVQNGLSLFAGGSYLLFLLNIIPILNFDGHSLLKELKR